MLRRSCVTHLIPYDGVGGVEVAARSLKEGQYEDLDFHKIYIGAQGARAKNAYYRHGPHPSINHPCNFFYVISVLRRLKPDIVIASLWRSCIPLLLHKMARPSCRGVLFLHNVRTAHFLDVVLNWMVMQIATEIWVDSKATMVRVPRRLHGRVRIVSFVTSRLSLLPVHPVSPSFIFWGRLAIVKGIDRAIRLFADVSRRAPGAKFTIIGGDDGQLIRLRGLVAELGLEDSVSFLGQKTFDEIRQFAHGHSFYLQMSWAEGMAMSVVEAMQLGLVPIVTPVGEIANYCKDGVNSIVIGDDCESTLDRIMTTIDDSFAYNALSLAASKHWRGRNLYREDVLSFCRQILS